MSDELDFQRRAAAAVAQAAALGVDPCNQQIMTDCNHMFVMDNQINFEFAENYDQQSEQRIINDFFSEYVGNFLVIGAANGLDQSQDLLRRGWNVVYCEPDPIACGHLLSVTQEFKPQVTVVNAAITPGFDGLTKFFVSQVTGLSGVTPPEHKYREIITNAVSINNLFKTIGYKFDYIQIDAEGLDVEIVRAIDWSLLPQCKMLCIESGFQVWDYLLDYGYVLTDFISPYGYNTIYRQLQSIDHNKNLKKSHE